MIRKTSGLLLLLLVEKAEVNWGMWPIGSFGANFLSLMYMYIKLNKVIIH